MERIKASSFHGPRAYFTNFDPKIVGRSKDQERLRRNIERRLKILLLTKNLVVCAASHLTSRFTYGLFRNNPILLNKGLVVPALRQDMRDMNDLFSTNRQPVSLKQEMVAFYSAEIQKTVDWELEENSAWFRDKYLAELKDERSVLRKNLPGLRPETLHLLVSEIEKERLLAREKIDLIAKDLQPRARKVLFSFRELIYHISGARVVNCESTLPQENYIDYSLADIQHRSTLLSEAQIFWKLFLELAFETMHKEPVPMELLDMLSFEDIYYLRQPIEKSSFRDNYDSLVGKAVASVEKRLHGRILYDMEGLLAIQGRMAEDLQMIFEKELLAFLKRKGIEHFKELGKNSVSFGLGIAGFFFPIVPGAISTILQSRAFLMNLSQTFGNWQSFDDYQAYLRAKQAALTDAIKKSDVSDKSQMLDVVDLLVSTICARMRL